MTESNSHDAVVNLKSKTMNIKDEKNFGEPSTKFFSLEESCKEIFFLARFLQDVLQKNALSCKTLKENLARSLQGTHFFSTRAVKYPQSKENQDTKGPRAIEISRHRIIRISLETTYFTYFLLFTDNKSVLQFDWQMNEQGKKICLLSKQTRLSYCSELKSSHIH